MFLTLSDTWYLIIGIGVIVLLVILFFLGYILNKKTPIPEECKDLIDEEKCTGCANKLCSHYIEKKEETNKRGE